MVKLPSPMGGGVERVDELKKGNGCKERRN
jgi:hypothetical protein